MRVVWCGALGVCLALASVSLVRADGQADVKPVLDKAIQAVGGEKAGRMKTGTVRGKFSAQEGGQDITVTFESSMQGRKQYRLDAEAQVGGMSHKALLVVNGDQGWVQGGDRTQDAPEGVVPFMRDLFYAIRLPQFLPGLRDKEFKLSPLGEMQVAGRDATGVLVAHKDHKDARLFFDKESGLPVKSEINLTDPQGKEQAIEYAYADYKEFDGVKQPTKVTIKADGKEFTLELSDYRAEDKLDESLFTKP